MKTQFLPKIVNSAKIFLVTIYLFLGRSDSFTFAMASAQPEKDLISNIQASHDQLLKDSNGFSISYVLNVTQNEKEGSFLWRSGSKGEIKTLWPRIYNKFEGFSRDQPPGTILSKEGEYNFQSMVGAGRANQFVQISPYRHGWSAVHLFPLMYQYFDEADQYFTPNRARPSAYWLPSALRHDQYDQLGSQEIEGDNCQIFMRRDKLDKIWMSNEKNYIIKKRELYDPKTMAVVERVTAGRITEVKPGYWFPFIQTYDKFIITGISKDVIRHNHTVVVTIDRFVFGNIRENELHIAIPKGAQVDDQIRHISYQRSSPDIMFSASLTGARARLSEPIPAAKTARITLTGIVSIIFTIANIILIVIRCIRR